MPRNPSEGLHTITPYFTVADADGFMVFVQTVFGAEVIKESRYDGGTLQHARLQIGDCVVMLNQATDTYAPNRSQMHIQVSDTAQTHALALRHGATSLMAPNLRPHGEHMAGVTDPHDNTWWIASPAQ